MAECIKTARHQGSDPMTTNKTVTDEMVAAAQRAAPWGSADYPHITDEDMAAILEAAIRHAPPASIPSAEVQALVERFDKDCRGAALMSPQTEAHLVRRAAKKLRDQLAALIPRNPE